MLNLRDYQAKAVADLRASLAGGASAPVLVAPTGSGKTQIAAAIIHGAVAKRRRVLFLAPRRELIFQTAAKLQSVGVAHGIIMAGERHRMYEPVQVACVPTLYRRFQKTHAVPEADLILIDECHLAIAATTRALMAAYPNATKIGLTATPARSDGKGLGQIFDDMVMGPSVAELTAQGFLVPVRYFAPSKPDLVGVKITAGDYNSGQLHDRMDNAKLIGDVVENWARICPDRQTVVFASGVAHAKHLCERFVALGVHAEHVDGTTPNDERAEILARLKSGKTQVLTSVDVVSMGFDEPTLSCGILARPTKSISRYLQSVGRILRPAPGKLDSIVIDHAGNVDRLGFVDEDFEWCLDGNESLNEKRERAKEEGKVAPKITCTVCHTIFSAAPKCPKCGHALPGRGSKPIEIVHDELRELDGKKSRKANRELTHAEKDRFFGELRHIAQERGYADGWASNQYRERLSVWPNAHKDAPPVAPSVETRAWVQSRLIRYAKSKGARA